MSTQPTYRAVLAVMLTDPAAYWYGRDLAKAAGTRLDRVEWSAKGLLDLGWIEQGQMGFRLTDRGRRKAEELAR